MDKLYFGLKIIRSEDLDPKDVAARLFLCPRITPVRVNIMLTMLSNGQLSKDSFFEKTDEGIQELINMKTSGIDLPAVMNNKLNDWNQFFKEPTDEDYCYVEKKYGITKADLLGDETERIKFNISSAKELADFVKQYIKGQDNAIEKMSVPFYLHLESKRKHYTSRIKTPMLLMGPTGIGKSEVLRIFGKVCDCPVIRINTSKITPNGWRGVHISDIIARQLSDKVTIKDLEYAVLVFHEFDKITHYGKTIIGNNGTEADADMMRDIMSLFETDDYLYLEDGFDNQNHSPKYYKLPVDNLLIVFDGAFQGIESIIQRRLNITSSIGFSRINQNQYDGINLQSLVIEDDLIEWGYMPELIGRIGNVVVMNPLNTDVIYQIMTTAQESILQSHIDYCAKNNIELHFTDEALYYIADEANKSGRGFRNVKKLLSLALNRLYYEMTDVSPTENKRIVEINKDYVMRSIYNQQL